jgi:hypothetical protein
MKRYGCALVLLAVLARAARGDFKYMQIEEIIGALNGNAAAQAIQLRMRMVGQVDVQFSSLWAADTAGANRIKLLDLNEAVVNGSLGARILITTPEFDAAMLAGGTTDFVSDFTLAVPIPVSYLTAGKLTFEADGGTVNTPGTVYWSVAWGGAAYTGTNFRHEQ